MLHCARTRMNEATQHEVIRLLNDGIDWDYIVRSSTRHGISPLLYRNLRIYNELSKVLKAFTDAGIDVIVLKGAVLAETVYKNVGLRVIGDVDMLVKKDDLSIAKKELALLGYNPMQCDLTQWHADQGRLLTPMHLPPYCKQGLWIEVHWHLQTLASPFRTDIKELL